MEQKKKFRKFDYGAEDVIQKNFSFAVGPNLKRKKSDDEQKKHQDDSCNNSKIFYC